MVEPGSTARRTKRRGRGLDIGRGPDHELRILLDTVLHVIRTGIPRHYLPHDHPPRQAVYAYFARRQEGAFDQLNTR